MRFVFYYFCIIALTEIISQMLNIIHAMRDGTDTDVLWKGWK